jgi:hypothetical protein
MREVDWVSRPETHEGQEQNWADGLIRQRIRFKAQYRPVRRYVVDTYPWSISIRYVSDTGYGIRGHLEVSE